jgi:CheY-like chemotaxis protein
LQRTSSGSYFLGAAHEDSNLVEPLIQNSRRLGILLAEDDDNIRVVTARILGAAGHEVFAARDGAEAVALFEQHHDHLDIAVLDFVMPKLTGKGVYDAIRVKEASFPVLFTTGYSPVDLEPLLESDINAALLNKPYRATELNEQIDTLISKTGT